MPISYESNGNGELPIDILDIPYDDLQAYDSYNNHQLDAGYGHGGGNALLDVIEGQLIQVEERSQRSNDSVDNDIGAYENNGVR